MPTRLRHRPGDRQQEGRARTHLCATPDPKWAVAVGGCGCGVFEGSYAVIGAVDRVIPVDLHIRGCPPRSIDL
jgi:NADH:ubiquinone oxidoreductase subunit B-like Fe-S oxidoreductase